MARPLRIEFPGALYHVTVRGNEGRTIFEDDRDRDVFLGLLAGVLERFHWVCHAYCLMPNHVHLVVETLAATLSRGIHRLNGSYAQTYNRRHGRAGHLFQGRFHAVLVEKETYLLEVARYVVLNPCRAGICREPGDWPWSSYRKTAGDADSAVVKPAFLLSHFARDREVAHARYRAFVSERLAANPWTGLRGQIYLGSPGFVERHAPRAPQRQAPLEQREPLRPPLADVVSERGDDALLAASRYGYSARRIASEVGLHRTTVARRIRIAEGEDATS